VIDPSTVPSSSTTSIAPTGSGAEPSTSTSSAWTKRRPSSNHLTATAWVASTTPESIIR
jgi:hypothetical protein